MAGRLVSLNWEGMASVRVWGSSQQKASMKLARPEMHKSLPSDVSGSQSARTRLDYAYAHGFGSCNRTTTFFRLKDGDVGVRCGCFYGTLAQFRDKVCETHGETKKAQEYLMLADLMEIRFKN